MKKLYLVTLCTIILLSNGCSNSNVNSTITESETTTEATVETIKETKNEYLPDKNTVESAENIEKSDTPIELPNTEGLTKILAEAFISIGLNNVPQLEFKNYENISVFA